VAGESGRGIASRREDGLTVWEKMLGRRHGEEGDAGATAWGRRRCWGGAMGR
jgi:hypothetical protein